jgi:hypothetical protein
MAAPVGQALTSGKGSLFTLYHSLSDPNQAHVLFFIS